MWPCRATTRVILTLHPDIVQAIAVGLCSCLSVTHSDDFQQVSELPSMHMEHLVALSTTQEPSHAVGEKRFQLEVWRVCMLLLVSHRSGHDYHAPTALLGPKGNLLHLSRRCSSTESGTLPQVRRPHLTNTIRLCWTILRLCSLRYSA